MLQSFVDDQNPLQGIEKSESSGLPYKSRTPHLVHVNKQSEDLFFFSFVCSIVDPLTRVFIYNEPTDSIHSMRCMRNIPDLILVNSNVGSIMARAFFTFLKGDKRFRYVPIIATGELYHREELLQFGFDDFYVSPQKFADISSMLEELRSKWIQE